MPKFNRYDAYMKYRDGAYTRTLCGAILTITCACLAVTLFISEFNHYREVHYLRKITADTRSEGDTINLTLAITLPFVSCDESNIDVEDLHGNQLLAMKNIKKTPYIPEISLIQSANRTTMINKGCLLEGTVALARAPGTFDFSLGSSIAYSKDYHTHQYTMEQLSRYNPSHFISKLYFGPVIPNMNNTLEGVNEVIDGPGHMLYFVKIVPTVYKDIGGNKISTFQYSYTHHYHKLQTDSRNELLKPGIFFKYEFSPIRLEIEEYRYTIIEFITSVCAILGGLYTVFSLVDSFFYESKEFIMKKMD